jgi:hypothetical protein
MSRPRLRTVVADTSALVSLAVPRADTAVATDAPDPFQYLFTSRELKTPLHFDRVSSAGALNSGTN